MTDTRIETFLTLCRVMNYRKTAEILNMTQPAVTQHIQYLENYYGCKLFVYDRRSLKMTPKAEQLKKYAENVLYQEKKLKEELNAKDIVSLSVGATKTIGEYVLAEHISAFLKEPQNRISVNVDNTERLLGELSRGEIDFALVEGFFDRGQYASRLYRSEPFVGLCGAGHPFAGRTVSLDEIWGENLILREEGSGTRTILEQLLAEHNRSFGEFERVTTISNFGLITRLLENGGGITFAFRAVKEKNDRLAEFRVSDREIFREFNYVYLDTPYSENAVDYFEKFRK
ncbi:MAG: LysR family transcriptional regulator [Oscillospiraceae bacterium]|nr:LysR family transcriptional regulator [Oscillospiraceae bacterium]